MRSRLTEVNRCPQCTRACTSARSSDPGAARLPDAARMRSVRRLVLLGLLGVALGVATPAAAAVPQRWEWPLAGPARVVHGFAPPAQAWLAGHRGVDLLGRPGQPVRAAGAGVVHFAGRIAGVGVVSVLHAGGLLTTYEPVRPLVRVGAVVRTGQPVGRLTLAGSHCAPAACLHWGLRRASTYLDPLTLVGAARFRLLPLPPHDRDPTPPLALAAGVVLVGGFRPAHQTLRRHRRRP